MLQREITQNRKRITKSLLSQIHCMKHNTLPKCDSSKVHKIREKAYMLSEKLKIRTPNSTYVMIPTICEQTEFGRKYVKI